MLLCLKFNFQAHRANFFVTVQRPGATTEKYSKYGSRGVNKPRREKIIFFFACHFMHADALLWIWHNV